MRHLLTADEMREAESRAVEAGATLAGLMEAAGAALAAEASAMAPEGPVVVAAGRGNNAGDGWVAARLLHSAGRDVRVLAISGPDGLPEPAAAASNAAVAAGVPWSEAAGPQDAVLAFAGAALVIDALLGIGARGEPRPPYAEVIEALNDSDALVLAADVPSGVDATTGVVAGEAVFADATVTFSAPKLGLALQPGRALAGDVVVADVGVPAAALEPDGAAESWDADDLAAQLPSPGVLESKYTRGRLLVVGGAPGMTGAVCLAASAALKAGAGYVTVACPAPSLPVIECKLTSPVKVALPAGAGGELDPSALDALVGLAARADAVVLGPGLGRSDATCAVARALLARCEVPVVADADALFALVGHVDALAGARGPVVLTPHAGEAGRLLGVGADIVEEDRLSAARELARDGAVVVLKGPSTIVAAGRRASVNATGGPGLAKLGTGDVLAGVLGALLAQGVAPFEASVLAVHLHGAAGDLASRDLTAVCCTAEDVVAYLPEAVRPLLRATT